MGSVWVADHLALGVQVAVKFMDPELAREHDFAERFRREAMAAAQIKSPHVAQVLDHGVTVDGAPYIVMELLEGETLRSRIRRLGPLPPSEVSCIIVQAAKALGRAHQLGIVHRDIKPDNLFLMDVEGELFLKVLDFGVAKLAMAGDVSATATGSLLGTPLYMSPEQLVCSKHVDLRADLWSLGVVAYHALTGRPPFSGDSVAALAIAIHAGTFAPPSAVRPGLLSALDAWMSKALQRDPLARFGTAKELAAAFEQAVGVRRGSLPSVGDFTAATAEQPSPPKASAAAASPAQVRTFTGIAATTPGVSRSRASMLLAASAIAGTVLLGGALWHALRPADAAPKGGQSSVGDVGSAATQEAPEVGAAGPGSSGTASAAVLPGGTPAAPEPAAPAEPRTAPVASVPEAISSAAPVSAEVRASLPPSTAKPPSRATAAPATSAAPGPTVRAAAPAPPATPTTASTQKKHEGIY